MINSKGSFSAMKSMNTALVLNKIREHGSVSRATVAKETGLTAATVTNITAALIKCGIVIEADTGLSTGGRKPILLSLNTEKYRICSAYISPNTVEFVVANFNADILSYSRMELVGGERMSACADYIEKKFKVYFDGSDEVPVGIGVALHGIVDSDGGRLVFAPNLDWNNVEVRAMLEKRLGIPVFIDNDVRMMTIGEMWYGVAKNIPDFVYVYVGDGIGGAIVINGELYRGFESGAGEIGHCTVEPDGELCSCGNRGCVQTLAGDGAMIRHMKTLLGTESSVLNKNSDCGAIADAYIEHGDPIAAKVLKTEAKYLGIAVANVINMFNPMMVVVDSDTKNFGRAIMPLLMREAEGRKMKHIESKCKVRYSYLGGKAVIKGGVAMVLKNMFDNPSAYFTDNE